MPSIRTFLCAVAAGAAGAAVFAATALGSGASAASYPWTFEQLADGVWAATQPQDVRFDDSNSLILIGSDGVTVVDAQSDPDAVRALIAQIAELTPAPVVQVINTHWHGDHTQGNAVYLDAFPDVEVIGHATLVQDIPERAATFVAERVAYYDAELPAARERLAQGVFRDGSPMSPEDREQQREALGRADAWLAANREARFLEPDLTYQDALEFTAGERTIQLLHVRAHTRGDTLVWLPDDGILASGDVLDDLPYVGHGYPRSWVAALDAIAELPFRAVVPGHGPVFRDRQQLERVRGYLAALVTQAGGAAAAGYDLETTLQGMGMERWRTALARDEAGAEFFDAVLPEAVERAWLEARGELDR